LSSAGLIEVRSPRSNPFFDEDKREPQKTSFQQFVFAGDLLQKLMAKSVAAFSDRHRDHFHFVAYFDPKAENIYLITCLTFFL
jgi:hypothetical protein